MAALPAKITLFFYRQNVGRQFFWWKCLPVFYLQFIVHRCINQVLPIALSRGESDNSFRLSTPRYHLCNEEGKCVDNDLPDCRLRAGKCFRLMWNAASGQRNASAWCGMGNVTAWCGLPPPGREMLPPDVECRLVPK